MEKIVNIGMIGLGARAETLLAALRVLPDEARVTAICDVREPRIQRIREVFAAHNLPAPKAYTDYRELLASPDVDAVLIPTSWNSHLNIAAAAMRAGKYAGIEVGGAASLEELWDLVRGSESTGVSCMMMENCCYGRNELLAMNLVRQGLFGELIHCSCGYEHYIADRLVRELSQGIERAWQNLRRNGDLYPTHGLGPIAKILDINHGNRFLTISSTASKARGFTAAAREAGLPEEYQEGDIITSVIRCANGETITLTHGISLPRPYSRDCRVQGTRGIWSEDCKGIYIHGISSCTTEIDIAGNPYYEHHWDKVSDYYEKYDHPIWQKFRDVELGGHGGMDGLVLKAFCDAVRRRVSTPIDVYDCAAWMAVSCLSEQSAAMGGTPVPFPDFTNGNWIYPAKHDDSFWTLNR